MEQTAKLNKGLLTKLRAQQIKPLAEFTEFESKDNEWDNIPKVIPDYISYLEKHIKEIAKVCTIYTRSEVSQKLQMLQGEFTKLEKDLTNRFHHDEQKDAVEKKELADQTEAVDQRLDAFKERYEIFLYDSQVQEQGRKCFAD